ncbi:hypothetical protein R3P38DRAFT_3237334 [Favolaschia claudopus]|uniref:Uncharacterized protein n=1 Tax=Favolaschia claudopus TaxID=2862362 RepID=A0AAV9ZB10_9AGAR
MDSFERGRGIVGCAVSVVSYAAVTLPSSLSSPASSASRSSLSSSSIPRSPPSPARHETRLYLYSTTPACPSTSFSRSQFEGMCTMTSPSVDLDERWLRCPFSSLTLVGDTGYSTGGGVCEWRSTGLNVCAQVWMSLVRMGTRCPSVVVKAAAWHEFLFARRRRIRLTRHDEDSVSALHDRLQSVLVRVPSAPLILGADLVDAVIHRFVVDEPLLRTPGRLPRYSLNDMPPR